MSDTWNVLAGVCHLVNAETASEAIEKVHAALRAAGFSVYEGDATPNAFPSAEREPDDLPSRYSSHATRTEQ